MKKYVAVLGLVALFAAGAQAQQPKPQLKIQQQPQQQPQQGR